MIYRKYKSLKLRICLKVSKAISKFYFGLNGIKYENDFVCLGLPLLNIDITASCSFGKKLAIVNCAKYSVLGKGNRSKFSVGANARLSIGDRVGMSNVTIISTNDVKIGNNILLGGGVTIVDTDFHSFNPVHWHTDQDVLNMKSAPVIIEDNVFIGMNSIILKGVTIGSNAIIGAGSVVSKDIPANEIWGGNPAKFIKLNK